MPTQPGGANFLELRKGEVRPCSGPRARDFLGSCAVASRNPLIHNGATNATLSGRFDSEEVEPCRSRVPRADLGGSLATANFREFLFHALR